MECTSFDAVGYTGNCQLQRGNQVHNSLDPQGKSLPPHPHPQVFLPCKLWGGVAGKERERALGYESQRSASDYIFIYIFLIYISLSYVILKKTTVPYLF